MTDYAQAGNAFAGSKIGSYVQTHLDSLLRRDVEAITEDFAPHLRPHVPAILADMPFPFIETANVSIKAGGGEIVVVNRLVGARGGEILMRSVWQEVDGRPRVMEGAPVVA